MNSAMLDDNDGCSPAIFCSDLSETIDELANKTPSPTLHVITYMLGCNQHVVVW